MNSYIFHHVAIEIEAESAQEAYDQLRDALDGFDGVYTDTYSGPEGERVSTGPLIDAHKLFRDLEKHHLGPCSFNCGCDEDREIER
jgi:hypothetical protein